MLHDHAATAGQPPSPELPRLGAYYFGAAALHAHTVLNVAPVGGSSSKEAAKDKTGEAG